MKSKDRTDRNGREIAGWVKKRVDGRKNIREKYRKKVKEGRKLEEAKTNILAENARKTLKMRLKTREDLEQRCVGSGNAKSTILILPPSSKLRKMKHIPVK